MIIQKQQNGGWLSAGSSPVDWCEENYAVSEDVAEFTNTISNVLFFLIPMMCLGTGAWKSFARCVSLGAYLQLFLFCVVGASSAYFHATLSLLGQMLDEVAILWLLCASYSCLTPNRYRPAFYTGRWSHTISLLVALILTAAWFVAPQINAYALFVVAVPIIAMQVNEIAVYKNPATLQMTRVALTLTVIGITLWVADKLFCGTLLSVSVPGLHNVWHVLIAIASYLDITVFGYLRAAADFPLSKPAIRYWPAKTIGLPYVECRGVAV